MSAFLRYLKEHWSAAVTLVGAIVALAGWYLQTRQTEIARRGQKTAEAAASASERQAQAAETALLIAREQVDQAHTANKIAGQQLALARKQAESAANEQAATAERVRAAEARADQAHDLMRRASEPSVVIFRGKDQFGSQEFRVTNEGKGPATDLCWSYGQARGNPPALRGGTQNTLEHNFNTNVLGAGSSVVFIPDYDRWMRDSIFIFYRSVDQRSFLTQVKIGQNHVLVYSHGDARRFVE